MKALTRILYATDLSSASMPAWRMSQALARATKAQVVVLHVMPTLPIPMEGYFDARTYQRLMDEGRSEAEADLKALAEDRIDPALRVEVRLESGGIAHRILEVAEGADLIVVGTHGRTGLNRLLLGSVAEQVLALATCAVVTVRPLPGLRALSGPHARLVFPTDFSPACAKAWPWARALAVALNAEVDLVHVTYEVAPDWYGDPGLVARASEAMRQVARESAERFIATCGLPADRVHVHITHGVATDRIVHWAQARKADLIVLGTHGRTGIFRLALGSVTRGVLHAAPCPVLTVGPQVPDPPPPAAPRP